MMIILCETCKGTGILPQKTCGLCHGAGIAAVSDAQVLYFGKRIDRATIVSERIGKVVQTGFTILVAILGGLGLAALIIDAWPKVDQLFRSDYWQVASSGKLWFSISLFAELYLLQRFLRQGENHAPVARLLKTPLKSAPVSWKDLQLISKSRRIDIARSLSKDLETRLTEAYSFAAKLRHGEVGPAHLVAAFLNSSVITSLLVRLEVDLEGLKDRVVRLLSAQPSVEAEPQFRETTKQILLTAYLRAQAIRSRELQVYQVLLEAIRVSEQLTEILFDLGVDQEKLKNAVRWLEINEELRARWRQFRGAAARRPKGEMNRAMTALETRALDQYADDLTRFAGRGYLELVVDREPVFEEVFRILEGERKSVMLVGNFGVGKESILNGIAQRMVEEEVPAVLKDRRLASLSLPKLIAGATPSEAGERLLYCFTDMLRARNVILAIPNVHEAVGGGSTAGLDLGGVLASELGKGYFLSIATTTPQEYRERIEGTALAEAFIKVEVEEPDLATTIQILESKAGAVEHRSGVYLSYNALEKAVTLSDRYLKERYLPEKAIDIVKETAQHVRGRRGEKALVKAEDVAEIISAKAHVPVTSVTAGEAEKLLNLEAILHERIIGQDEAVKAVAAALRRARAELREAKRPIANFLFLGPTGVGKTETAKTVAEVYFGNEENMIRVDMSEYQDKSAIYRLLGAPGEKGGLLTEPVRKNPFALVLLDELEKAHPDILNVFLQVMDDGRVTDSAGRVVDFTNTIIIGTSNAGTQFIQDEMRRGTTMEEIKKALLERELKQYFRPEFLNRFDAIVVYKPLTEPEIVQIAKLILAKIAKQLEAKGISFRATDDAVSELAHAGFDPQFGARPLRRVIQERVQDALANLLLTQKISRRDVVVLEKGGTLRVEKAEKL